MGAGARHKIPAEVRRLGMRRVLLVATLSARRPADELAVGLGPSLAARFDGPTAHTPVSVTLQAMHVVSDAGADAVVALGGGSAIGLGKAISIRAGIPHIAVPTTYAGSEVTPTLGETENGAKTVRRDPALAPGTVVYDPELTLSMPAGLTRASAVNALAHAVEALWAPETTAASDAVATEAAEVILTALPAVLSDLSSVEARGRLQEAAWLAGVSLAQTRMGLQHQLAHLLGGAYDLPHAALHALLLPHVMAYNLPAATKASARLTRLAGRDPVAAVAQLAAADDRPGTLAAIGVPREGIHAVAQRVVADPYPNPRPVDLESVTSLLERAWSD
jgi:alcohol dehydrogenase class IV